MIARRPEIDRSSCECRRIRLPAENAIHLRSGDCVFRGHPLSGCRYGVGSPFGVLRGGIVRQPSYSASSTFAATRRTRGAWAGGELRRETRQVREGTYRRWESNPHSRRNGILNPARLPIPPHRRTSVNRSDRKKQDHLRFGGQGSGLSGNFKGEERLPFPATLTRRPLRASWRGRSWRLRGDPVPSRSC